MPTFSTSVELLGCSARTAWMGYVTRRLPAVTQGISEVLLKTLGKNFCRWVDVGSITVLIVAKKVDRLDAVTFDAKTVVGGKLALTVGHVPTAGGE